MNDSQLILLAQSLIEFPSFKPKESSLPKFLMEFFKSFKIKHSVIESDGVINIVSSTSPRSNIIFNGHWDTVYPPIENKNDRIFSKNVTYLSGLGSCDMKAGVASMIAAFIDCYHAHIPGITLCLVGDEETGGKNGTKILVEKKITGNYVILGEPTGLQISLGQKGGLRCVLNSRGIASHGAYPQRGENAIIKLLEVVRRINQQFPLPSKDILPEELFSIVTASVNTITGGTSENVVADTAQAVLDIRIPSKVTVESIVDTLRQIAMEGNIGVEFDILGSGWELQRKSSLTKLASDVVEEVTKHTPQFIYKMGTNDGKYYAKGRCQIINIGPGDNKLSHTGEEKVSIEEIKKARKIYVKVAEKLSKKV